jgi:hypothetical protein
MTALPPACGWCGAALPTAGALCSCGMRGFRSSVPHHLSIPTQPHNNPHERGTSMTRIILAAFAACLIAPATAGAVVAQPPPTGTATLAVDTAACKATVTVTYGPGKPGTGGIQVNVNHVGAQDTARKLNTDGDALVPVPGGPYVFEFQLADGGLHVLDVWLGGNIANTGVALEQTVDCREPVPPVIERVEVPVRVEVPGPVVERRVPVTVTKRVASRCRAAVSKRTGRRVLVCPKPRKAAKRQDCKRPRVWHPGVKRCVNRPVIRKRPAFTG